MEKPFFNLKEHFTTAPILTHHSPECQFIVEIEVSDFALGAIISQKGSDDKLHPIACHLCRFSPAVINYEIYDRELLGVLDSFKIWGKYLAGCYTRINYIRKYYTQLLMKLQCYKRVTHEVTHCQDRVTHEVT
jgi:hypothetical protein